MATAPSSHLGRTAADDVARFIAQGVIQLIGIVAALICWGVLLVFGELVGRRSTWVFWTIIGALLLSLLAWLFTRYIQQTLGDGISGEKDPSINAETGTTGISRRELATFIAEIAAIDFVALLIVIYQDGGPTHSAFVPFLLIIVPLAVVFNQNFWLLVAYWLATFLVFLVTLVWHTPPSPSVEATKWCLFAITMLCASFPVWPELIKWKRDRKKKRAHQD